VTLASVVGLALLLAPAKVVPAVESKRTGDGDRPTEKGVRLSVSAKFDEAWPADDSGPPRDRDPRPPRPPYLEGRRGKPDQRRPGPPPGDGIPRHRPGVSEALTSKQQAQVKAILSKYDASSLTADDARAIHEAFRQAGLHAGPAMEGTIKAAGFDPGQLRDLAPPPGRDREDRDRYSNRPLVRRGSPDPAETGDRRSPPRFETFGRSGGSVRRPATARGNEQERQARDKPEAQGHQMYSIEQAISDRAQLHTIAFNGLAFITGEFSASTFIPPGKVCAFFGFQYMRDIDAAGKGHNPMFLNRVVGNVMRVLSVEQRQLFLAWIAHSDETKKPSASYKCV